MTLPGPKEIEAVARDVLRDLLGQAPDPALKRELGERSRTARAFVGEGDVRAAKGKGLSVLTVPPDAVITPLARDVAHDLGVDIRTGVVAGAPVVAAPETPADAGPPPQAGGDLAVGSDHGGFALKKALVKHLQARGLVVHDVGTHSDAAVDYPDIALAVAKAVALGKASWGILVDGAGIGSCMAANKVPGVLAATCHDERTAKNSREHNGANVLCLGSGGLDEAAAKKVVDAWLATPFGGGRHGKRVEKIKAIERSFVL